MAENPEQITKDQRKRLTFLKTLNIAVEFGFIIVLPLLGFGYLGKYLDNRYHVHYNVIIGIIVALVTSGLWFYKVILQLMKDMKD